MLEMFFGFLFELLIYALFYCIGYGVMKIITAGKYPKSFGEESDSHAGFFIGAVTVVVPVIFAVVVYQLL
jgi:hypothetical protein